MIMVAPIAHACFQNLRKQIPIVTRETSIKSNIKFNCKISKYLRDLNGTGTIGSPNYRFNHKFVT